MENDGAFMDTVYDITLLIHLYPTAAEDMFVYQYNPANPGLTLRYKYDPTICRSPQLHNAMALLIC